MPDDISLDTLVARKPGVLHSVLDDEVLAFDVDSGAAFVFRLTARQIWELLEAPISVQELCARMGEIFQVDQQQCHDEVLVFLRRLNADGVIQVA
jgi:Coenzyme PQQ synthesis protein D (PqqD)